jgi:hypothetical protein
MKQALSSFEKEVKNDRKSIDYANEIAMRHCNIDDEGEDEETHFIVKTGEQEEK